MTTIDGVIIENYLYHALRVAAAEEQQDFSKLPRLAYFCPWCGKTGKDMDLHHWLLKRSTGISIEALHTLPNVVYLHTRCHQEYGQTKSMTAVCWKYKSQFHNIPEWLDEQHRLGLLVQSIPRYEDYL